VNVARTAIEALPRSWAERSRSTRTPTTRRWRCRPRTRCGWRCGHSR
jgi:hypothetical protein